MGIIAFVLALTGTLLNLFQKVGSFGFVEGINLFWIFQKAYEAFQNNYLSEFVNQIKFSPNNENFIVVIVILALVVIAFILGLLGSIMALFGKGADCLETSSIICFGIFAFINICLNTGLYRLSFEIFKQPVNSIRIAFLEFALWGALYAAGAGYSRSKNYSTLLEKKNVNNLDKE